MDFKDVGSAVWRHRLLFVTILVVTGAAVGMGLWLAPKSYVATATVTAAASPDAVSRGDNLDSLRGSVGELANAQDVVAEVAARIDEKRSVEDLRRSITGRWVSGTILLQIEVTDSDPVVAAEIANTVAEVLPLHDPSNGAILFTTSNPAQPAATFSSPNLLLGIGVGALLALVLAVGGTLLRDRRTSGIGDACQVAELAQAPVLAHLTQPKDPTALPALYPGTAPAEVFRQLRISLEAEASDNPVSVVVVTGSSDGELHVWLGANLAVSLANVSRRVLLVDGRVGDLDGRPLTPAPGTAGLYDVLTGSAPLDEALSPGPVENLTVLPVGRWGGESADALLETSFGSVMAQAAARFDIVVVVAPPLDRGDDARLMASSGSVLLALPDAGLSPRELRRHTSRFHTVGIRLLGVVLVGRRAERMAS